MGKQTERLGTPKQEIQKRFDQIAKLLEEARVISANNTSEYAYYDGPAYGMGGYLESGEWRASSGSC